MLVGEGRVLGALPWTPCTPTEWSPVGNEFKVVPCPPKLIHVRPALGARPQPPAPGTSGPGPRELSVQVLQVMCSGEEGR